MNAVTDRLLLPITSGIQMSVAESMTFTIADVIGQSLNPFFLTIFSLFFILCSLRWVIKKLTLYCGSSHVIYPLAREQQCKNRTIRNPSLKAYCKKVQFQIVTTSSFSGSPFVAGLTSPIVYIPLSLSKHLSRKEYEAVLAHEMEHIRYKDSLVRTILDFIGSVFWWVPTQWLQKRIEEGQEVGCDLKCKNYGINPIDLASAICKSAKNSLGAPHQIFAYHLAKHTIHRRVNLLLQMAPTRFRRLNLILSCLALGVAFLVVIGRFWIF